MIPSRLCVDARNGSSDDAEGRRADVNGSARSPRARAGFDASPREDISCTDEPSRDAAADPPQKRRWVQLHLDAGQRDLSHCACAECGMVYAPGAPGDNALHRSVHARIVADRDRPPQLVTPDSGIGQRVASPPRARVLAVRHLDTGHARRWVQRADAYVASQIGDSGLTVQYFETSCWVALLYVSLEQRLVDGYLLLERVTTQRQAKISSEGVSTVETSSRHLRGNFCGVRRIWVAPACRRRGIASTLLEQARMFFGTDGQVLSREGLVFTTPTRAGALLALSFMRGRGEGTLGVYEPDSTTAA
jgi:GNAT superfamily N-acetyltransferase